MLCPALMRGQTVDSPAPPPCGGRCPLCALQTACPLGGVCAAFADKFLFPDTVVAKPMGDLDELAGTHEQALEDDTAAQV
jgi:hypothetical protein